MRTAEVAFEMLKARKIAARDPVKRFMYLPSGSSERIIASRDARRDSSYSASWLCLGGAAKRGEGSISQQQNRPAIQSIQPSYNSRAPPTLGQFHLSGSLSFSIWRKVRADNGARASLGTPDARSGLTFCVSAISLDGECDEDAYSDFS